MKERKINLLVDKSKKDKDLKNLLRSQKVRYSDLLK